MKKIIDRNAFVFLLVSSALLIGFAIRIIPAILIGSPINDGGLFFQMTRELQQNHYQLPLFTSYNDNQAIIPYVYPPFGFYLTAFIQSVTGIDLYQLFRFLPGILAGLTIPSMYFLASAILGDRLRAALATLFYATIPVSFISLIMGGGITRSPGIIFSLLTLGFLQRFFIKRNLKFLILTSLFASLVILTHPESAFHTLISAVLLWAFFGRDKESFFLTFISAGVAFLLTSPWWIYILQQHGLTPFLTAIQDRLHDGNALFYMLQFNLTGEPLLTITGVFAAIGLTVSLVRRNFFLPAWILVGFLTSQRAGPFISVFPIVFLAVTGLEYIIGETNPPFARLYNSRLRVYILFLLIGYNMMSALIVGMWFGNEQRLLPDERTALASISREVPKDSRFVVMTGDSAPNDPLLEWFPALSGETSLATIQGHEWTKEKSITPAFTDYQLLQTCMNTGPDCIENWAKERSLSFTYIYIRKLHLEQIGIISSNGSILQTLLRLSQDYKIVYESPTAVIFAPIQ